MWKSTVEFDKHPVILYFSFPVKINSSNLNLKLSCGDIMLEQCAADCDVTPTGRHDISSLILLICLVFHLALTSLPVKLSLTSP